MQKSSETNNEELKSIAGFPHKSLLGTENIRKSPYISPMVIEQEDKHYEEIEIPERENEKIRSKRLTKS